MSPPDLTDAPPPAVIHRPGWHPDPTRVADLRYWNGKAWTDHTREHGKSQVSPLAFWGIVAGLLLPILGVVIAIILFVRSEVGPGIGVLVASGLGFVIAAAYLAG